MNTRDNDKLESRIGQNIKLIRQEQKLTQKQLAQELGTMEQTISKIERGIFNPSAKTVMRICAILDVTPNDLMLSESIVATQHEQTQNAASHSLTDMMRKINDVQLVFAKADIAHDAGDTYKEHRLINQIIQMFAPEIADQRKIAEWLNREYMSDYLAKIQTATRDTLHTQLTITDENESK